MRNVPSMSFTTSRTKSSESSAVEANFSLSRSRAWQHFRYFFPLPHGHCACLVIGRFVTRAVSALVCGSRLISAEGVGGFSIGRSGFAVEITSFTGSAIVSSTISSRASVSTLSPDSCFGLISVASQSDFTNVRTGNGSFGGVVKRTEL